MYNLIEYTDAYSKTSGSLWPYYRDDQVFFGANNNNDNSNLFKFKEKTEETDNGDSKDVEIIVPLKYLCKFWKTLKMSLSDCEINHILNWSASYFLVAGIVANQFPTFAITDKSFHGPVVTFSTQDNAKLLEQLNMVLKEQLTGININLK